MTVTSQVAAPPVAPGAASRRVPSRRRLAHGWRALRTGVAFASFGVGAIVVAAITAVSARGVPARRELRTQRVVHHAFRLWLWWMVCLRLCRVSWIDGERLAGSGPRLVVANHPTLIDVILLLARLSQADCIVKTAARRNPFMRRIVARAGYLANDDGDALVESCADRIAQGRSVLLFPEGTRSPRGGLHRFHWRESCLDVQFDFAVQAVARNTLVRSGNDGYSSLVQRPRDGHEFCKPSFLEIRNRRGRSDVRQDCSKFRWDLGNT